MSDDRFKEARRSLIDDEDDQSEEGAGEEDGEEIAEEKTQMVNLDELQKGAAQNDGGQQGRQKDGPQRRGGSPSQGRGSEPPASGPRDDQFDDAGADDEYEPTVITEGYNPSGDEGPPAGPKNDGPAGGGPQRNDSQQPPADPPRTGGQQSQPPGDQPSRGGNQRQSSGRQPQAGNEPPPRGGGPGEPSGTPGGGPPDVPADTDSGGAPIDSTGGGQAGASGPSDASSSGHQLSVPADDSGEPAASSSQKLSVPGDQEADASEKTAFVNINDFAEQEPDEAPASNSMTFTPDDQEAGHEGSTHLVDINELQQGAEQERQKTSIEDDEILAASYQFGPGDIHRDGVTLIYATNEDGEQIILRQVWSGDADEMPANLRERINAIDKLSIEGLMTPRGMVITESGAWLELPRPEGRKVGDILREEGPQEPERVVGWIRSIADILGQIHEAGLVYANLTPETVWIDEEDEVVLESFDVSSLANRGDLGQFGPPEMSVHDEATQHVNLTPAADVYSLAALMLGGITGIPLDPQRVASIESDELTDAVRKAVVDGPRNRIQSVEEFVDQLGSIGGPSLFEGVIPEEIELDPRELDFKVLLAITATLMLLTTGVLYIVKGTPGGRSRGGGGGGGGGAANNAAPTNDEAKKKGSPSKEAAAKNAAQSETSEPPGPVESDPRLTITGSYKTNPPADANRDVDSAADELKKLRKTAREKLKAGKKAPDAEKEEVLTTGLEAIARSIRLQDGAPTETDKKLINQLYQQEPVRKYYKSLVDKIDKNLENGRVSQSRLHYQKLRAIDPTATSTDFFTSINSAKVKRIEPVSDEGSSGEDGDE
jgi:serine/threonine protein kinase